MTLYGGYAQSGSYPASVDRVLSGASLAQASATTITRRNGVIPGGSGLAVTAPGGMNIRVGTGVAMLPGGYIFASDGQTTVAVAAAGTSVRTDLVVARFYDTEGGDLTTGPAIEVITGPAGGAQPAMPLKAILLATISVPASVSAITSGYLTDFRSYTAANGGLITVPGALAQPNPTSDLLPGMVVWDPTTPGVGVIAADGTWLKLGSKVQAASATVVAIPGGNVPAGGGATIMLGGTAIAAAPYDRVFHLIASALISAGTVDIVLRQSATELARARATINCSAIASGVFVLSAGQATSFNVQALSTAGGTIITDPRYSHVDIIAVPVNSVATP